MMTWCLTCALNHFQEVSVEVRRQAEDLKEDGERTFSKVNNLDDKNHAVR